MLLSTRLSSNPTSSNDRFYNGLLIAVRAYEPVRQLTGRVRFELGNGSSEQENADYPGHLE